MNSLGFLFASYNLDLVLKKTAIWNTKGRDIINDPNKLFTLLNHLKHFNLITFPLKNTSLSKVITEFYIDKFSSYLVHEIPIAANYHTISGLKQYKLTILEVRSLKWIGRATLFFSRGESIVWCFPDSRGHWYSLAYLSLSSVFILTPPSLTLTLLSPSHKDPLIVFGLLR